LPLDVTESINNNAEYSVNFCLDKIFI